MKTGKGLYDPAAEHDSCGLAFVATLRGTPGRDIVDAGLTALRNLDHRGAVGAEENSGDGAGILTQIPDEFLRAVLDVKLPPPGEYAIGLAFFPGPETAIDEVVEVAEIPDAPGNVALFEGEDGSAAEYQIAADAPQSLDVTVLEAQLALIAAQEGLAVLTSREVPTNPSELGPIALSTMPVFRQIVLVDPKHKLSGIDLDRRAFRVRKRAQNELGLYFASLSSRTLVYKGMLTTEQLQPFFPDLSDPRFKSEIALVHSRFSTNTFPSWPLAHPMRYIAHNGEMNTIRGNRNWIAAREGQLEAEAIGDIRPLLPICTPGASDSASFDEVLELLHLSGRSLPHAVLMMIPEAWEHNQAMDPAWRAFYDFHLNLMEPWDGPAALAFTDGTLIGAVLTEMGCARHAIGLLMTASWCWPRKPAYLISIQQMSSRKAA